SRNSLAQGYFNEGLFWSAYHLFHEVRNLTNGNLTAELGLAQIWDKWGDYSLAQQHIAAAIAINPGSFDAYETLGRIHLHRNSPVEAAQAFKRAVELEPERAATLANLGYADMLAGNSKDAQIELTKALALDPSLAEAHNNLGILLAQSGDYQGSLEEM